MYEGVQKRSMSEIVENLRNDPKIIENKAKVIYRLSHPSKQISTAGDTFHLFIEPAGWSQLAGSGPLDLEYFFWIFIKCKPSAFGTNEEDRLSSLMEYVAEFLHGKKWGELHTFHSRAMINYRTVTIKTNNRDVYFELAKDEIGATMMFWQSLKKPEPEPEPPEPEPELEPETENEVENDRLGV